MRTEEQRRSVRYRRVTKVTRRYWARIAVTVFVCWHLIALGIWTTPQMGSQFPVIAGWVRTYLTTTGFNQGWTMFAPNPYATDVYVECRIHYTDGTVRSWYYPQLYRMNYWLRYQKERWRKYVEVANLDQYRYLWPPMAKYGAKVNNLYPNNPPVSVDLIAHKHIVPPPDQPSTKIPWQDFQITSVSIAPEDLK